MRRTLGLVGISIAACLATSLPCAAAEPAPGSADPTAAAPAADALPVMVKLASTPVRADDIRAAIETELHVSVRVVDTLNDEGLSVAVKWRRATVSYRSKQGETTSRSLDLPANSGQAVEVIALMAGNLARDEASELLARLAPPPSDTPPADAAPASEPAASPADTAAAPPPPPEATKTPETAKVPAKPPPAKKKPAPNALIRGTTAVANLTFWHPKTLIKQTERKVINMELGAIYSRVGAVEGFGFTFGYLRVDQHAKGFVSSFGWTRVDGDHRGMSLGLLFSEGHGLLRGYELGGLGAFRWGNVRGAQTAVLVTTARNVHGVQASAGVSTADDVEGVQAAPVAVARDVEGLQLNLVGVARETNGGQVGLVNVAKTADFQLGLVNVAERVDGASIGLVSIAGNGYVEPTAFVIGGTRTSYNAGVKFVAGLAYSVLAGGMTGFGADARPRTEVGAGLHLEPSWFRNGPVVDRTAFELGAGAAHTFRGQGSQSAPEEEAIHYRAALGVRLAKLVWLFGGVDVSHGVSPVGKDAGGGPFAAVALF